jgi:hypothetical protein
MNIHAVILLLAIPAFVNIIWLLNSKPGAEKSGQAIVYATWVITLIVLGVYRATIH